MADQSKLGPQFTARLRRLRPQADVRVVVMLQLKATGRGTRSERIAQARTAAEPALQDLDLILGPFGGRRLRETATALGSVSVETTAAGVRHLAESPWVKAILEDQPVTPVR